MLWAGSGGGGRGKGSEQYSLRQNNGFQLRLESGCDWIPTTCQAGRAAPPKDVSCHGTHLKKSSRT